MVIFLSKNLFHKNLEYTIIYVLRFCARRLISLCGQSGNVKLKSSDINSLLH